MEYEQLVNFVSTVNPYECIEIEFYVIIDLNETDLYVDKIYTFPKYFEIQIGDVARVETHLLGDRVIYE